MDPVAVGVVVAAYLVGSVDFGVIIPRLFGVDIYRVGSGNPGASNVLRSMGRKVAAVVVVGDVAKGFAAAMTGDLLVGEATGFAAGFAAVVGHCFPLWHRFRGGKGVAAAGGMTWWLEPLLAGVFLAAWASVVAVTRRASIASLTVVALLVPGMAFLGHRGWSLAWSGAAVVLVATRHQENIRRLLGGSEHPIEESV